MGWMLKLGVARGVCGVFLGQPLKCEGFLFGDLIFVFVEKYVEVQGEMLNHDNDPGLK